MRDPERIDVVLDTIREYWKKNPDLRLCQIIGNALDGEMSGAGYNTEDHELLDKMGAHVLEHEIDCDYVQGRGWCPCPRRPL